jgi:UPF0755 protein
MTASQRFSKWFFYLLLFPGVLALCGWQGWQWWSWASAPVNAATTDQPIKIKIPSGTSADEIGENLAAAGLIRSTSAWDLWTKWQSWQNREGGYLAGTYELSPSSPLTEISQKIWTGEVAQQSYTIPEGWSIKQMAEYFEAEGYFSADEFVAATEQVPRDRFAWLPEDVPKLEGFLYPDTYVVSGDVTPADVVNQMLARFEEIALPVYSADKSPYSFREWVTLASIVEKEAVIQDERPTIASVFAKRLKRGMPLGADPTVEYGLGIRQTVDKPLTYAQVETPSPYNTYIIQGLPPTPIASPGLASLEASLNPGDTEYLYFMARYDGTHIFSRTLAEHEAAKITVDQDLATQDEAQSGN